MKRIRVIDSHTGGEPTRVIVAGGPDVGGGPMAERLERFRRNFDHIRSAVVNEPRGNDAMVGALLAEPADTTCDAGVIFFDNAGYLNMCGHGSIGLAVTLAHMGRAPRDTLRFETVCGVVEARLHDANRVTIRNVASYRYAKQVAVEAPGIGTVRGDIAWGGNWFFLVGEHGQALELERVEALTDYAWRVRQAIDAQGLAGADGRIIDHVQLFGPPAAPRGRQQELRPLPRQGVRPLALRHRHQRPAGLPVCRWRTAARANLAAGEHHGQRVRRERQGGATGRCIPRSPARLT